MLATVMLMAGCTAPSTGGSTPESTPAPSVSAAASTQDEPATPQTDSITEVPITIHAHDGAEFEGLLRMPGDEEDIRRLVIYVNSSGPHTYDDRRLILEQDINYHDLFVDALVPAGVAYFSYNTRGVAATEESPLFYAIDDAAYQTYMPGNQIRDVEQVIRQLREMEALKDAEIVLLGWSEGTMIAPQVALAGNVRVDRLLLAGYMHRTMADTLASQQSGQSSMVNVGRYYDYDGDGIITKAEFEEDRYGLQGAYGQFADIDLTGDEQITAEDYALMLAEYRAAVFAAFEGGDDDWLAENYALPLTAAWYQDHATFPPNAEVLPTLDVPIEVFHGRFDGSVPVEDVYALEQSFRDLGKDNLTIHVFEGGDHDLNYGDYVYTGEIPEGLQSLLDACTE